MSAIFLSYRRDDSSGYAGRLFDNLAERFGRERVFMDIETLEPGMDFVAGIDRAIESCGAVIAMIGPNWVNAQDAQGRRRLEDANDFIRLEIELVLKRGVRVIPVLVHDAAMPHEQELPESLRPLCRLQAFEISDNRWEYDVNRLGVVLEPLIADDGESRTVSPSGSGSGGRAGAWVGLAAVLLLAAGGGIWWISQSAVTGTGPNVAPVSDPRPAAAIPQQAPLTIEPVEAPAAPAPDQPDTERAARIDVDEPPGARDMVPLPLEQSPRAPRSASDSGVSPAVAPPPAEPLSPDIPIPRPPDEPAPSPDFTEMAPEPRSPPIPWRDEIDVLLEAAHADLENLRLTRPAGENAFERFQRVLELDPENEPARRGLEEIVSRYHGLVEEALQRGDLDRAQRHIDSARSVNGDVPWLGEMQREIERRRHDAPPAGIGAGSQRERATCLANCDRAHEACVSGSASMSESACLERSAAICEERYQACMSDTSKMFMGPVSHESECAGVHIKCSRAAASECAGGSGAAVLQCDRQRDECRADCGRP